MIATGAPTLKGALAVFDCEIIDTKDLATHRVLFGKVTGLRVGDRLQPADLFRPRLPRALTRRPRSSGDRMTELKPRPAPQHDRRDAGAADRQADYVADRALATVLFLSLRMKPAAVPRRRGGRRQDRDRQGAGRARSAAG